MLSRPQAEFIERTHCINCGSGWLNELSKGRFTDQPLAGFIESDPSGEPILPYFQNAEWSLVKCGDCTQVFQRRILTDGWNEKQFNHWMSAEAITEFESRNPVSRSVRAIDDARAYVEHILRIDKLTRGIRKPGEAVRLLDFGCGWGHFLEACKLFGFDAVGVDRSNPRSEGASIPIFPSIEAMGDPSKFHAVTLFEVLEHLDEPSAILNRLSKLMLPGGVLVLETPDCAGVSEIKTHYDYLKVHPLEHINAFTNETMKFIGARNGFEVISKGAVHVTAEIRRVAKREIKHLLGKGDSSTRLYFRRKSH